MTEEPTTSGVLIQEPEPAPEPEPEPEPDPEGEDEIVVDEP